MSSPELPVDPTSAIQAWERAYQRFESSEQELKKFVWRLRKLGVTEWDRGIRVLELFCGRGNGIDAWRHLGFNAVEGLDLSERLLSAYCGPARVHLGDARALPFPNGSCDVICIQGGLHHLTLMDDLRRVLSEIHRVLDSNGKLVLVEPWLTPFLRLVHAVCGVRAVRRLSARVDALATMIELERETYDDWLARPHPILHEVRRIVEPTILRVCWGKLMLVGFRTDGAVAEASP